LEAHSSTLLQREMQMTFTVTSDSFNDGDYLPNDFILAAEPGSGGKGGQFSRRPWSLAQNSLRHLGQGQKCERAGHQTLRPRRIEAIEHGRHRNSDCDRSCLCGYSCSSGDGAPLPAASPADAACNRTAR
jgi:hypothetical protein